LTTVAQLRRSEPPTLIRAVHGDLDWIVMKAMEKDRGRRYETANGLAMDVRRYLNDEAVQACPPSALYRFRKFARRNKGRLLAVALVATGLVAGVVLLAVSNMRLAAEQGRTQAELRRADGNLTVALEALDEVYMKEIENRGYRERQLSGPDRDFLRKGLDFYQKFARQNIGHSGLHKEAARADRRLGFLWRELQQLREAEASFSRAIPMFEMLVAQAPEVADHRLELARCLYGRSLVLPDVGRTPEAQSDCSRAIALWEALAGDPSATRNDRVHLGHAIWHKSRLDADSSRYTSAEHGFTRALHLFEKLSAEFPQERFYRQEVAASHRLLAEVVYRPTSRWDEAERHIRDARTIYAALCAEVPSNVFYRTELVYTLNYLAGLLNQAHQPQQAEEVAREAAKMQEKLLEPYRIAVARTPDDPWAHHSLADVLASRARFAEAEAAFREAIRLEPNDGGRHHNLGDVLRRQGKLVDAAGAYTEAIRLRPGEEASHYSLGHVYACMGQWEKAAGPFAEAAKLAPTNFWTVYRWATLCLYTNDLPNYRRACQAMLEQPSRSDDLAVAEGTAKMFALFPDFDGDAKVTTLAELTMAGTEASPHRKSYETLKALIDYRTGRFAPAVETIVRSAPADELHRDALAFSILAMARHRLGQRVEAGAALAKAQQILATKMPQIKKGETFQDDWHDWLHAQILCREAERTLAK
jgi:tetratricopeptide (TPR) repeat protein